MQRALILLYTGAMAIVTAAAIVFAVQAYHRADGSAAWHYHATALKQQTADLKRADAAALKRFAGAQMAYSQLTAKVEASQTTLAAEIARVRSLKPKIITGSTVVSYVKTASAAR